MAVILHRFEELSYKEIAEVLNCSVAAVESLLHRAKMSLRGRLERYFHDEPQVSIHSKVKDIER
jgi:RNA polymerase sigma-70 factor (ECF subfamily)